MPKTSLGFYISKVPVGAIVDHLNNQIPPGFLLADGSAVSKTQYPTLFAVIGYSFGGSGDSFNLPDCREVVVAHQDQVAGVLSNFAAAQVTGSLIGVDRHQLTQDQMPNHGHDNAGTAFTNVGGAPHTHPFTLQFVGGDFPNVVHNSSNATQTRTTNSADAPHSHGTSMADQSGSGHPHSNVQRVVVCNSIIAYAEN